METISDRSSSASSLLTVTVASDTQQSLFDTVQQEITVRRQKSGISRQDSRLSVKSLIESIENAQKQAKNAGTGGQDAVDSKFSSTSSINSFASDGRETKDQQTNGSDYGFESNTKLITFSRSQSLHDGVGDADWIENNVSVNNKNNFDSKGNSQVSD